MLSKLFTTKSLKLWSYLQRTQKYCFSTASMTSSKYTPTAFVSGGNRGIGLDVCKLMVENDVNVIMGSRNLENAERAIEKNFPIQTRTKIHAMQLDICDSLSIKDCSKKIRDNFGGIDILINNAGINLGPSLTLDAINETFKTNYFGTIELTETFLPILKTTNTNPNNDGYHSRVLFLSNRDAALSKLSDELQQRLLDKNLKLSDIKMILNDFTVDGAKRGNNCVHSGYIPNAYLMSYVALNMYVRLLGQRCEENLKQHHWISAFCPGYCTDDTDQFSTTLGDPKKAAYGITTLALMPLSSDIYDGSFWSSFYKECDDLSSICLEIMDWKYPEKTISWDYLCQDVLMNLPVGEYE